MNWYRITALFVSSLIIVGLFGVVIVLAYQGDHDMRVAVISFITGVGVVPAATSIGKSVGPEQGTSHDPPTAPAVTGESG